MKITLETGHASLGVVVLRGLTLPDRYDPLPDPPPVGDVQPARRLHRSIGLDPTRNRPSSEALFRRIRRGEPLPRINALVDAANHCSVRLMRPFGLYDLDRVEGDLFFRVGREGEGYEGLGKPWVNLAGHLALVDAAGPIGNPSSDSFRTRIRPETRNALVLVYGPADDAHGRLDEVAGILTGAVGGAATTRLLRPGSAGPLEL